MAFLNALFLLLAPHALAVSTEQPSIPMPAGVLQLSLFPAPPTNKTDGQALTGRQVSVEADNYNYFPSTYPALETVIEIGTPPQRVIVEPDTGSVFFLGSKTATWPPTRRI